MVEYKIKDNYLYIEYPNCQEMFFSLDDYLTSGYKITDSAFLAIELTRENNKVLLSYTHIDNPNENIKEQLKALHKPMEKEYPDYNDTILNVIAAVRNNFGYSSKYKIKNGIFDKKYKHVVLMLLDGLGNNVLFNNMDEKSFLRTHYDHSMHAIFPSTTAAATTSWKSALPPITTAWTGWSNYVKEIGKEVILFRGTNYYTDEPTGISLYDYIPYNMFYCDMSDVKGHSIEPDFSLENFSFKTQLKESLKLLKSDEKSIQYVYWINPDSIMHEKGVYAADTKMELKKLDKIIKDYADRLPEDTILIISADHSQTDIEYIDFYTCKPLYKFLERNPSNDGRCITFKVKDGMNEQFEKLFNSLFGSVYELYKTSDAIANGFFGEKDAKINPRALEFLADYVAIAIDKYYFNFKGENAHRHIGHHAGITRDEMIIPVCIYRR